MVKTIELTTRRVTKYEKKIIFQNQTAVDSLGQYSVFCSYFRFFFVRVP